MNMGLYNSTCILFHLMLTFSVLFNSLAAKHSGHHVKPSSAALNSRLHQAYTALQAWKRVIYSDPNNFTSDWVGLSVCNYAGVYCSTALDDPETLVVAGIDLNHQDIAGFLPDEIGLLTDLALLHVNSNRFCGILPPTFARLKLLYELDLSNNRFVGPFPSVVLSLPALKYLDLRYNEFEGSLPSELFNRSLDAIFINNNRLRNVIPANIGASSASAVVFANNDFGGCLPPSISKFANTLEELVLINTNISGCLPEEVGFLYKLRVLDVSFNKLVGPVPYSVAGLAHLEQLNLGHNMMSGDVMLGICVLPRLENFTFSYNFFCEEEGICANLTSRNVVYDDRVNCLPDKPLQRSKRACDAFLQHPVDCLDYPCGGAPVVAGGVSVPPAWPPLSHP